MANLKEKRNVGMTSNISEVNKSNSDKLSMLSLGASRNVYFAVTIHKTTVLYAA
ncbi:hypothetical protein MA16_Dca024593 [Dendrobium catenatum]|uniref:Uncharacterized protein n=1 Tax=Dendrobium catenatum TaxID=906689 RepID=A0A2I0X330_9ASPA|nr:hypothetical protein MA16_Dca024593 [Dendrobium catenatum]